MPDAAAIYVRASWDPNETQLAITRQEKDCRALAKRRGWRVGKLYVDNNVSGWKAKDRPAWLQMLADIKAGEVDAVIVWHLDRLTRRPIDLEHFFEVCDAAGIKDLATVSGDVDLSTFDGQFLARILGAVARKESDDKSRRIRRKHLELAEAGKPVGGGRCFGYQADRVTIDPIEAALVREAADRVLAGQSLRAIGLDWNRRGIVTPAGRPWSNNRLKRVLTNWRMAGVRSLADQPVAKAIWEPILDEITVRRLRALLLDPGRRVNAKEVRTYVLTGLLRCWRCEGSLISRRGRNRARTYICCKIPGRVGCGGLRVVAEPLEAEVLARLLYRLSDRRWAAEWARQEAAPDTDEEALLAAIEADEGAMEQLARDHYVDRKIGRAEFMAAREGLQDRLSDARSKMAQLHRQDAAAEWRGRSDELAAAWVDLSIEAQRAILDAEIESITIGPGTPGWGFFDPNRVKVNWRR